MATTTDNEAKIVAEGMLSYPVLFEPRPSKTVGKDGKPKLKYSTTIIITDDAVLARLKKFYIAAVYEKFGEDKGKEMLQKKKLKSPFLTEWEKWDYPEDSTFIRVSSVKKPGVVADFRDPETGKPAKILDSDRVYAGVMARATLRLFWYDNEGNKGFSFGLNNIQRLTRKDDNGKPSKEDWPRLDGRANAEDDFEADDSLDGYVAEDDDSGSVTGDVSDLV
jgi:hypothetical protein